MKETGNRKLKMLLMLVSVLALMLCLSGCRTRLTNNMEVNSTIDDEEGWLQTSYDERRDMLGIPVAKKPFFTGREPDEEDYGYDDDAFSDYDPQEPEPWEEEPDEPEDNKNESTSSSTTTTRTSGTTRRTSSSSTKKKGSKSSTESTVTVTLDATGGKCDTKTIKVKKGGTYGALPDKSQTTRDGYTFAGWFTAADGGSEVLFKTKVTNEKKHTLYAHWTKNDEPPAVTDYNLTFKTEGVTIEGDVPQKTTDGKYPALPTAKKDNTDDAHYIFLGWSPSNSENDLIKEGDACDSDKTLTPQFDTWEERCNKAREDRHATYETVGDLKDLVAGDAPAEGKDPDYVVTIIKDFSEANASQAVDDLHNAEKTPHYPETTRIIVVPENATKDENILLYKMMLLRAIYGKDAVSKEYLEQIAADTGATLTVNDIYPALDLS